MKKNTMDSEGVQFQ